MKKIFLLLMLVSMAAMVNAQTNVATVSGAKELPSDSYVSYWGAKTDTLVASDTLSMVLRVRGNTVRDLTFGLLTTKVSGTVTNDFVFYYSMDGANWTSTGDTLKNNNASTNLNTVNIDDFNYPYLKVQSITGSTAQKAWYKLYAISRNE